MGISVTDPGRGDLKRALETLQASLAEVGYDKYGLYARAGRL